MSKTDSACDLDVIFVCFGPGLQGGLELELLGASNLGNQTELALSLLLYLDTLVGLLFYAMHQSWSYAWVSYPHHPPLLDKKPSSASIVR
jgi:hypothetical protein